MINILNRTAYVLLGILLLMIAPFLIPKVIGFIPYAVLTDSMEPAYSVGSLIYVKESAPETIQVGDVITFRLDVKSGQLATHRVVANNTKDKEFITKGITMIIRMRQVLLMSVSSEGWQAVYRS